MSLYEPKVYKALQSQIKKFTSDLKTGGIAYAKDRLSRHDFNLQIGPVIMSLYQAAAIATANRTQSVLNKKLAVNSKGALVEFTLKYRTFGHNEKWTQDIIQYFRNRLLDKVVTPISQTTHDQILKIISKGVDEGWSVDKMVKEIEGSEITKSRARLIVRTETTRATNYGGMMGAYNNDYEMEKMWNEVKDNRTRISHRHGTGVGGQKIDLLDRFTNGLMFPGDPEGSAAEVCNCRCVLTYSPKRDSNGRLIPKKKAPATHTREVEQVEDINSSVIVNVLSEHRTLAQELAELAVSSTIIGAINNLINDHLN